MPSVGDCDRARATTEARIVPDMERPPDPPASDSDGEHNELGHRIVDEEAPHDEAPGPQGPAGQDETIDEE